MPSGHRSGRGSPRPAGEWCALRARAPPGLAVRTVGVRPTVQAGFFPRARPFPKLGAPPPDPRIGLNGLVLKRRTG
ncbi:hypothetical protein FE633_31070 [Streptomyces montanus]|uniref:Uncharacterized protein n=1 Tax=Streptomyces montanus TaxID=2580423 RepID=A0A5R9FF45_9ACTN|nr:hypothetical protein FE633_31070 [Streptomyces montanus]